ncbi:hypothetical protein [Dyadobacter psychrotolerans]|uniref:Uncharacterized protein n=1 Tax=Dyadobacter psychrotolerans TaxID=2541721 RepID=A0A4R5DDC0_9BACT|nr:hypothetical protein [Dyadobacter psychrotolerans]TDE11749.1 hypothetical protein E0F88_25345 [Dyadobacter psychrotolerans]
MKKPLILLFFISFGLQSCSDDVDPVVNTLYVNDGSRTEQREKALLDLYQYYTYGKVASNKEYYEVVSKKNGRFILNYYPSGKLLTLCGDPGSGWSDQFKNIDESILQKLANANITFDDIEGIGSLDCTLDSSYIKLLPKNDPFVQVKTNGIPSL